MDTFSAEINVAVGATVNNVKFMVMTDHYLVKRHIRLVLIILIRILEKIFNVLVTVLLGVSSLVPPLSWIVFHLLWLVHRPHSAYLSINSSLLLLIALRMWPPKFLFLTLSWLHGIPILRLLHCGSSIVITIDDALGMNRLRKLVLIKVNDVLVLRLLVHYYSYITKSVYSKRKD